MEPDTCQAYRHSGVSSRQVVSGCSRISNGEHFYVIDVEKLAGKSTNDLLFDTVS